jgi:hypothetical protein
MTGALQEEQYTFFIISRSVRQTIRNVSDKNYTENLKKSHVQLFFSKIVI